MFKREESYSSKLSVISFISKKAEKRQSKNYIRISLTNFDYKIIAIVFCNRLKNILPQLINENQTAYRKERYTGVWSIYGWFLTYLNIMKTKIQMEYNFSKTLKKLLIPYSGIF